MLLRTNTLAKGYSGIRLENLESIVEILNKGVHPIIPAKGSVGASGDLAPLSHMILVLIGEGKVMTGKEVTPRNILAGFSSLDLQQKKNFKL